MKAKLLGNKLFKYQALLKHPELKQYIPKTYTFTKGNFFKMLGMCNEMIIKPIKGSGGKGVRKVTKTDNGKLKIHHKTKEYIIKDSEYLYNYVKKIEAKRKRPFIIQNYISLAKVNGRIIDFRYIVQRKKGTSNWMITGKHAKVARKGYVITNLQVGAEVLTVEEALEHSNIKDFNMNKTLEALDHVALLATTCLSSHFKDHTIWGYDMAVDESGHVWIIEANSSPLVGGFRFLDDPSMYETINNFIDYNKKQK